MANRTLFASGESIGQYTVDALLGPGHHYIVYRAHDAFEHTCALKVLLSEREQERQAERAMVERVEGLCHGHLAAVRGLIELPEAMAVVTDYVDGPSLRRWLGRYRPTPDEVLLLFKGILGGTHALHEAGVVHGAINPGNVLLGPTEEGLVTKVSDFGAVRSAEAMSMYAARYLAPEVMSGDAPPSERADLWSLGCVLYELTTGQPPFDATDRDSLEELVHTGKPAVIDARLLGLPVALEHGIAECLRKDASLRPQSAEELYEMLYGNTMIKRIAASRDPGEGAEQRGTAFASEVGLAVARSLGPGEGAEPPQVRENASVEAVARRRYRPKPEVLEDGSFVFAGAAFVSIGVMALVCAGGMLALSAG